MSIMYKQMSVKIKKLYAFMTLHKRWTVALAGIALSVPLFIVGVSYALIAPYEKYVVNPQAGYQQLASNDVSVGIVLGAGITNDGRPFKELQSRLDSAADALEAGRVKKLILSGDNRFASYDEPTAMKRYLVERRGIDADKLQEDFAGRSTYESCERAAKVFQLDSAVIFSAGSHLPRAIYLCRHFGVEAYGVASAAEANNANRREAVARVKALMNVFVKGERTILGSPIPVMP